MKKVISLILTGCMLLSVLMLTGCAGFFADDTSEGIFIKEIKKLGITEEGEVQVAIYFTDEEITPVIFTIPPGIQGEDGNGILGIKHEHDDELNKTKVTITFTDEDAEPCEVFIKDGLMIEEIVPDENEDLGKHIYLVYNDGTMSDPIPLPQGEAGVGIESYIQIENDDKSVDTLFTLTNGEEISIKIPAPQTGNGIEHITSREENGKYILHIVYTDGNDDEVEFVAPNKWYTGRVAPDPTFGVKGDYYVDTANKVIYNKGIDRWDIVINFRDQLDQYTVVFDLNDPTYTATMPDGYSDTYTVLRGSYFADNGYGEIPKPTRDGYNFVGWYTKKNVDPSVMSPFTDLTAVFGDLELYAIWEAK